MTKMLLAIAAAACVLAPAGAAPALPSLSEFILSCNRDSGPCRLKLKDYVNAGVSQKIICLPKDVSVNEGAGEILRWIKSDAAEPLKSGAYDDALYEASSKLYPCTPAEPPPAPPAPPAQPAS